ncbi:MAG: SDR family NAD(P)-dependent oxidoreductase [Alphaproteobacteria bacterium]|jgi:3-oxoacyl-[acyl-carrier protein] reductase|nr:SDR family oxidoreductase [Alphaproteobacteria bacterium]MDB2531510.1 SDR family oxidoreductase [Alphaproteobacteria bacterium]MDC0966115.1 SDR family NAD(P)-dependent oxidoreductase [Alphaproteobacteria bacterium]MDC1156442.1 SDR family NAD(P)-dependent oxidoreductase [Alphaproteobacteria bacterium]
MNVQFDGQTILVTGAVRGIGKTICHRFAELGGNVWAADIEEDLLHTIVEGVSEVIASRIRTVAVDVTDPKIVQRVVENIQNKSSTGAIDITVHSAGGVRSRSKTPIEKVSDSDWRIIQAVNVDGAFNIARAVVPKMKNAKHGRIIIISSRAGIGVSLTGIQSYGTAKAAQIGLVKQLSAELGQFGITVNSVAPGFMPTSPDYVRQWDSYGDTKQKAMIENIAMRRIGEPNDIANAVIFFASDFASWITGQTLAVTGGP